MSLSTIDTCHILLVVATSVALLSRPVGAADPSTPPRIGVLVPQSIATRWEAGLRDSLRELGYIQGKTVILDWRRFEGSVEQARPLAEDLVRTKPDLIVALTTPATRAVMGSTPSLPVIFVTGDPVGMGFAESLSRPGKNGTGVSLVATELTSKRLELLKQLVPQARRVVYLQNPSNPISARMFDEARRAAQALRVRLETADAQSASEVEEALRTIQRSRPDALLVSEELIFASDNAMSKISRLARETKLPAIYPFPEYHLHGGLMSYGVDRKKLYQVAAAYIDKILKGAKPAELPVEQISKYELIIDLGAARAMRITVPQSLLLRADQVIQ